MRRITFTCRVQFDEHSTLDTKRSVMAAMALINLTLQRDPFDLDAQLIPVDGDWDVQEEEVLP